MLDTDKDMGGYSPPGLLPESVKDLAVKLAGSIVIVLAAWVMLISLLVIFS